MGVINASGSLSFNGLTPSTISKITNLPMALADTEYNHTLEDGTKALLFKMRKGDAIIKYAFTSGETATKYCTLEMGNEFVIENVLLNSTTLYVSSSKASRILEILEWR